jgi:hypothetical protein
MRQKSPEADESDDDNNIDPDYSDEDIDIQKGDNSSSSESGNESSGDSDEISYDYEEKESSSDDRDKEDKMNTQVDSLIGTQALEKQRAKAIKRKMRGGAVYQGRGRGRGRGVIGTAKKPNPVKPLPPKKTSTAREASKNLFGGSQTSLRGHPPSPRPRLSITTPTATVKHKQDGTTTGKSAEAGSSTMVRPPIPTKTLDKTLGLTYPPHRTTSPFHTATVKRKQAGTTTDKSAEAGSSTMARPIPKKRLDNPLTNPPPRPSSSTSKAHESVQEKELESGLDDEELLPLEGDTGAKHERFISKYQYLKKFFIPHLICTERKKTLFTCVQCAEAKKPDRAPYLIRASTTTIGNLLTHIERVHIDSLADFKKLRQKKRYSLGVGVGDTGVKRTLISSEKEESNESDEEQAKKHGKKQLKQGTLLLQQLPKQKQEKQERAVVDFFVDNMISTRVVESPSFTKMMKVVSASYKPITRQRLMKLTTIRHGYMKEKFKRYFCLFFFTPNTVLENVS